MNQVQNGNYFKTGYHRYLEYSRENAFKFSLWPGEPQSSLVGFASLQFSMAKLAIGFIRINLDLFGWPILFCLFLPFSWKQKHGRMLALSFLTIVGTSFVMQDAGIDTYGPVHLYEAGLPAILFIVLGVKSMQGSIASWISRHPEEPIARRYPQLAVMPQVMVIALILVSLVGYAPIRINAIRSMADNINAPFKALREKNIHDAVIFSSLPLIRQEPISPTKHFVFYRPNNDPDLRNDVLWVDHVSLEEDMKLMREFPQRKGFLWSGPKAFRVTFVPLNEIQPGSGPSGVSGLTSNTGS